MNRVSPAKTRHRPQYLTSPTLRVPPGANRCGAAHPVAGWGDFLDQVALFQLDGDEDVAGRSEGEDEVAHRHPRGGPEGDNKARHDGRAEIAVEAQRLKAQLPLLSAVQGIVDLLHAEEVCVANHEWP